MTSSKGRRSSRDEGSGAKPKTTATIDSDTESLLVDDNATPGKASSGGKRVDAPTAERRLEWVRKAIIQGFGTSDILSAIDKDWKISRRQAFRYIAKALSDIREASTRERSLELGKAIERNEMIIRKALSPLKAADVDLRTAVRANAQNARLMGLEAPTRHAHGADPDLPALPGGDFIVLVQEVRE